MPTNSPTHLEALTKREATVSPPVDGEVAELVERLLNLHKRMLEAVRKQRPYPVRMHWNDSDTTTVIGAAILLEVLSRNTCVKCGGSGKVQENTGPPIPCSLCCGPECRKEGD